MGSFLYVYRNDETFSTSALGVKSTGAIMIPRVLENQRDINGKCREVC